MFTGIVRELARVEGIDRVDDGAHLIVSAPATVVGLRLGDSVSLNGCCLTATAIDEGRISFTAVPETLEHTALGLLTSGSLVNIEPALRVGDPLGGHIVQGHVDGVGEITALMAEGEGRRMTVSAPESMLRYCVHKGSITVDGVSLTIATVRAEVFEIALIPHTLEVTTLGTRTVGDRVNLEVDVLAKHVERLTAAYRTA